MRVLVSCLRKYTANIYSGNWDTVKHCNFDIKLCTVESTSNALGAAIGCQRYSRSRAATGGKAAKAWSLARFSELESGGSSGGAPAKWPPLWLPCLPKIYRGGPEKYIGIMTSYFGQAVDIYLQ